MTKFIQVCASQDDLFALDDDGDVYQYNFNAKRWVRLVASRSDDDDHRPRAQAQDARGSTDSR